MAKGARPHFDHTLRAALEGYGGKPEGGLSNPGNSVLALPDDKAKEEIRPDLSLEWKRLRAEIRPRLSASQNWETTSGKHTYVSGHPDIYWNYATISTHAGPFDAVYGLENYQWGPGELISPSNPLTPEQVLNQVGLYEAPGQHQLRINASIGQNLSLVAEYRPGFAILRREKSAAAVLGKAELRGESGRWYAGLTGTGVKGGQPQWGGYAQYEVRDGTFFYLDAVRQSQTTTLYPVLTPPQLGFAQTRLAQPAVNALGGMRYSSPRGNDLRLEYLHQDSGYSRSDWRHLRSLLQAAPPQLEPLLAGVSLTPGPLIAAAEVAYVSLRVPDLGRKKAWTIYSRTLAAVTDASAFTTLGVQWNANDHVQWLAEGHAAIGATDRALTRAYRDLFNVSLLLTL